MSSALMIASVTAVIRKLLKDRLAAAEPNAGSGAAVVTSAAPDPVVHEPSGGGRLNAFMYPVTANDAVHGHPPPRPCGSATPRPLAVNLHYLITAYSAQDLGAEALLEIALLACHEMPVVSPDAAPGVAASGTAR